MHFLILINFFRDNGFGGCEETMVTNNCDQYAYSDACSDAWYLYSYFTLLFSYMIVEKNGIRFRVFSSLYVDMSVIFTNCLQNSYIYICLPQLISYKMSTYKTHFNFLLCHYSCSKFKHHFYRPTKIHSIVHFHSFKSCIKARVCCIPIQI